MASPTGTHERLDAAEVERGSDRSFGLTFAAVGAVLAVLSYIRGRELTWWWAGAAFAFLIVALVAPRVLAPANRLWFRFGLALSKVVSPVVMGLLFYGAVTPTGLLMRLTGADPLRRRWEPKANSYWLPRNPPGPAPESMPFQF